MNPRFKTSLWRMPLLLFDLPDISQFTWVISGHSGHHTTNICYNPMTNSKQEVSCDLVVRSKYGEVY